MSEWVGTDCQTESRKWHHALGQCGREHSGDPREDRMALILTPPRTPLPLTQSPTHPPTNPTPVLICSPLTWAGENESLLAAVAAHSRLPLLSLGGESWWGWGRPEARIACSSNGRLKRESASERKRDCGRGKRWCVLQLVPFFFNLGKCRRQDAATVLLLSFSTAF